MSGRPPALMQDFGEAGFEAGAFASGEDEDGNVVIGHGQSIVYWTWSFDNAGIGRESSKSSEVRRVQSAEAYWGVWRTAEEACSSVVDFPGRGVGQEAADELGVEGMAGFAGFDAAEEGEADEGEVADEIEGLVAAEFVGIAEGAVHDAVFGEDDGVIERAAADQTHGAERLDIGFEAEGAGAGENLAEGVGIDEQFDLLLADEGMGKIHVAANAEFVGGIDADAAAVFDDFDGFEDAEVAAFAAKAAEAGLIEELKKRLGGTVENGDFDVVEVDEDVVDAVGVGGGEKVFGGGEQDALLHEAGGIADAGDVVAVGFDGEIVEVDAAEDDAGIRRSGLKAELGVNAGVEADALGFYGRCMVD